MARQATGAWFRAGKNTWDCTVDSRMVSLGVRGADDSEAAKRAWHKRMSEIPEAKLPEAKPTSFSVQQLVDAFLNDAKTRLKANTVRIYSYQLASLCELLGKMGSGLIRVTS